MTPMTPILRKAQKDQTAMKPIPRTEQKNLSAMTLPELQDLLQRQQRLLNNKGFVNKLPDKGAKMLGLVERLTAAIATHRQVDATADLFQQLAINAESSRRRTDPHGEDDVIGAIVNNPAQEKVVVDERPDERMDERGHDRGDDIYFTESYKRVIKTPNKGEIVTERFVPNRIPQKITEENKSKPRPEPAPTHPAVPGTSTSGGVTSRQAAHRRLQDGGPPPGGQRLRHRYDDSLEEDMRGCPGVHDHTKMISIEESVSLLQRQKKYQEETQTRQAMERLAQRLGIDKVIPFDPEGSRKMAYRVREDIDSDDDDSDDDAKEKDYPDEPTTSANMTSSKSGLRQSALSSGSSSHVIK